MLLENVCIFTATLNGLVIGANATFQSSAKEWRKIEQQFSILQAKTEQFRLTDSVGRYCYFLIELLRPHGIINKIQSSYNLQHLIIAADIY